MKCKTLHKNLIFFLEGDLPAQAMIKFERHLSECQDCSAFALEVKSTLEIIEIEKSAEPNPFFYTRLKAKLENQELVQKSKFWQLSVSKVLQPVFFSIILLIGIYGGIKIGQPLPSDVSNSTSTKHEMIPYFNEMATEPIETFLME